MKAYYEMLIIIFITSLTSASWAQEWRILPIRSQQEYELGIPGGEGMQHPHSITRCLTKPEIIYISHDVNQFWRSSDAGRTWQKPISKGMYVRGGESIQVDPINPNLVFLIGEELWDARAASAQGLYRSDSGGYDWDLVLPVETGFATGTAKHRMETHNIAYDPTSVTETGATRWYAVFQAGALYISEDKGITWQIACDLNNHKIIRQIKTHPTDGQSLYLTSDQGLFVSHTRGSNFSALGNLPAGPVTSVEINPTDPNIICITLFNAIDNDKGNNGLYRSIDGGNTFTRIIATNAVRVFMNPGYPDVIYLMRSWGNPIVSHDGFKTWFSSASNFGPGLDSKWRSILTAAGGCPEIVGVSPNPKDADEAVAFGAATLWKTTDRGKNFLKSSTAFCGFAVWKDTGFAFSRTSSDVYSLFLCDEGVIATNNGGKYFTHGSHDVIQNWFNTQKIISGNHSLGGDIHPTNNNIIVAAVGGYGGTKIARTTDGGQTWSIFNPTDWPVGRNTFIKFDLTNPDIVYAEQAISYDNGITFSQLAFKGILTEHLYKNGDPAQPRIARIVARCDATGTLYAMAGQTNRNIYRSDDKGLNWYQYTYTMSGSTTADNAPVFKVDPNNPDKLYGVQGSPNITNPAYGDLLIFENGVWRGTGVINMAGGTQYGNSVCSIALDPRYPGIMYAATLLPGLPCVFRSIDGGQTWKDITNNLHRCGIAGIAVHPRTSELLAGSASGTWVLQPHWIIPVVTSNTIKKGGGECLGPVNTAFNQRNGIDNNLDGLIDNFSEITDRIWPADYGQTDICLWKDDKLASVSITIDDNWVINYPEIAQKYGFKFTWFVTSGADFDKFRLLVSLGHDVQSHTYSHKDTIEGYRMSKEEIEANIPGIRCLTMAYPGGDGLDSMPAEAGRYYIGARGTDGAQNKAIGINYMNTNSFQNFIFDTSLVNGIENIITSNPSHAYVYRAWQCKHFHGLTPEIEANLNQGLEYLKNHEADFWVGLFREVVLYAQERDSAKVSVKSSSADQVELEITDIMDDKIFDYPLTLKVRLDNGWQQINAVQSGKTMPAKLITHDGNTYALVEGVPDKGNVILSKDPAFLFGDVNGDGFVRIDDAAMVAKFVVGLAPKDINTAAADVDGNGAINIQDAALIAKKVVGLIDMFPVEVR